MRQVIPVASGLTNRLGELGNYYNASHSLACSLEECWCDRCFHSATERHFSEKAKVEHYLFDSN